MPENQQLAQPRPTLTPVTEPSVGQVNAGKLSFKIVRIISLLELVVSAKLSVRTGSEMAVDVELVKLVESVELVGFGWRLPQYTKFNHFN